jgi:hypothetical protein
MTLRTKLDPKGSQRGRKNTKFFTNIFQKGNELLESPTLKGSPSSEKKQQISVKAAHNPHEVKDLGSIPLSAIYLYTKKCQKCGKMYGTDFKTSKYCYNCSFRPKKYIINQMKGGKTR